LTQKRHTLQCSLIVHGDSLAIFGINCSLRLQMLWLLRIFPSEIAHSLWRTWMIVWEGAW
jgi:hypothetical protein